MTVLVDTSVWIAHFRRADRRLAGLLDRGAVATHPFVVGELACGNLRSRTEILRLLAALPTVPAAAHDEALRCLDAWDLAGTGLGWIGVHLLASARLGATGLWTLDKALTAAAARLGVAAP